MVDTLTTPAEVTIAPQRPYGVLAAAAPAPEGWELGGLQVSGTCPEMEIIDGCVTIASSDPTSPHVNEFGTFLIRTELECATVGGTDIEQMARDSMLSVTDKALAQMLRDGGATGQPSLDDATALTAAASWVEAVSALEAAVGDTAVPVATLHAPAGAAAYLMHNGLIDGNGRSPAGHPWIISGAYSTPADDGFTLYATGRVWAAVGAVEVEETVARPLNRRTAWASRLGIVAFDTCINLSINYAPTP